MNPERWYIGQTGTAYHQGKRAVPNEAVPWISRLRAQKIQAYVSDQSEVFEFGAGFGWNLAQLKCARKAATDLEPSLREVVEPLGIEFFPDTVALSDRSFDVVLCHHMLEHAISPPAILREIRRLLRPGGKLLLYVPWEREAKYRTFDPSEPNHHLYSWNVQTMGNLLSETGFKVQEGKVVKFGYDRFAAMCSLKARAGEPGFHLIRSTLLLLKPAYEVFVLAQSA
jgi:SAM-dependent methyltransferase